MHPVVIIWEIETGLYKSEKQLVEPERCLACRKGTWGSERPVPLVWGCSPRNEMRVGFELQRYLVLLTAGQRAICCTPHQSALTSSTSSTVGVHTVPPTFLAAWGFIVFVIVALQTPDLSVELKVIREGFRSGNMAPISTSRDRERPQLFLTTSAIRDLQQGSRARRVSHDNRLQ